MNHRIISTLVKVVLAFSVLAIEVAKGDQVRQDARKTARAGVAESDRAVRPARIPLAFVDAYAVSHQPTIAGANVEWNRVWSPRVRTADITVPGGTITYGEALRPRRGLPGESPESYLNYLSEVGKVRRYVKDLLREWKRATRTDELAQSPIAARP